MICLVPFGYPFFPKYAIVDFLKLRLRTWVRTSDSGRCRLPRLQHKKNPWSADPGPGPKKIKICTQVITTEMSPDEMFFGKKKSVFVCSFSWPSPKFLLSFVLDGILIVHEKNWHQKTNNRNPKSWKFTSKRFSLSFPDDGNYTPKNERMTIIARKTTMNEDVSPFLLLFSIVMLVSLTVASSNRFWSAESGKYLTSHLNSSPYKGKWSKNWKIQGYSIAPYRTMVIS